MEVLIVQMHATLKFHKRPSGNSFSSQKSFIDLFMCKLAIYSEFAPFKPAEKAPRRLLDRFCLSTSAWHFLESLAL